MSQVGKTYRPAVAGRKKHKRPFSKAILKQVGDGGERKLPSLFSALFADSIKQMKAADKENRGARHGRRRRGAVRPLGDNLDNMNLIVEDEEEEFALNSSFDKLLQGKSYQPVKYKTEPGSKGFLGRELPRWPMSNSLSSRLDGSWEKTKKKRSFILTRSAAARLLENNVSLNLPQTRSKKKPSSPTRQDDISPRTEQPTDVTEVVDLVKVDDSDDEVQESSPSPCSSPDIIEDSPQMDTFKQWITRETMSGGAQAWNRRRSRHRVSMSLCHRSAFLQEDKSLAQIMEESDPDEMGCGPVSAWDSRRESGHTRSSRLAMSRRLRTTVVLDDSLDELLEDSGSEETLLGSVSQMDMSMMHKSISHRVVYPMSLNSTKHKSVSFRDVYLNTSELSAASLSDSIAPHGPEETEQASDPGIVARDLVLQRCGQTEPLPFSEAFPDSCLKKCRKLGEGVYGEVFSLERPNGVSSVLKIIPIEGDLVVNGEQQKTFEEILSEIVIAMELSELRHGKTYRTAGFSELIRCWCVQGKYPDRLLELWQQFSDDKGSENDAPDVFGDDQLYVILELANAGSDLEGYTLNSAEQALAVFVQVAYALAVAEGALEFEHRDLHWGNVLLSPTSDKTVGFTLDGEELQVPTRGIKVVIIDFTLSRMTYDGCCIFNDLAQDPSLFTSEGDFQFEVYRLMKSTVRNDWQQFRPYTNVLWLRYLLDKLEREVHYRRKNTKIHRSAMAQVKQLKGNILDAPSCTAVMSSKMVRGF